MRRIQLPRARLLFRFVTGCIWGILTAGVWAQEAFRITGVDVDEQSSAVVFDHEALDGSYYRLLRGADLEHVTEVRKLEAPAVVAGRIVDDLEPDSAEAYYTIEALSAADPLDSDRDGIDDLFELLNPLVLDPLDPSDALLDTDDDGKTNLQEYFDGTDPNVPDVLRPPTLTLIGSRNIRLGGTLKFTVSGTDPDGDQLIFAATPVPLLRNARLDSKTGDFTFKPDETQVGEHVLTFSVRDGQFSAEETITITVEGGDEETSLSGSVVTFNAAPLEGVTLEIDGRTVITGTDGIFSFSGLPAGEQRLLIDGSTIDPVLGMFATVPEVIRLIPGGANELPRPIVLLPLDVESGDMIDSSKTSTVTSSPVVMNGQTFASVTLTVPPGTAKKNNQDYNGLTIISGIPSADLSPMPLPDDMELGVYISLQPFGVLYDPPAPISFPNVEGFPAGAVVDIFGLNHATGKMEKVGEGRVSFDERVINSIGGVVKDNSWHGFVPAGPIAVKAENHEQNKNQDPAGTTNCDGNSSLVVQSGEFYEDHYLPSYRSMGTSRSLRFVYKNTSANPCPIVSVDSSIGNLTPPPEAVSTSVELSGVKLADERYGLPNLERDGLNQYRPARMSRMIDATAFETGVYDFDFKINCHFPSSRRADSVRSSIIVQNEINSPFGAGWTLDGLQCLHVTASGDALLTTGDGGAVLFERKLDGSFASPKGDYSQLVRNGNGTFTRRLKNGFTANFRVDGLLSDHADRNGNTTVIRYDGASRLKEIEDPAGLKTQFAYRANGMLDNVSDPAGRVTKFEHDARGNLCDISNPDGTKRTFFYDKKRLMSRQTDERGQSTSYTYDKVGRVAKSVSPDGSKRRLSAPHVKSTADLALEAGTKIDPVGIPPVASELRSQLIDRNGEKIEIATDSFGAAVEWIDPLGQRTKVERDENSNPRTLTRKNGSIRKIDYDERGNPVSLIDQDTGAQLSVKYDPLYSLPVSVETPRGQTTTIERDLRGNPIKLTDALGRSTQSEYDARGMIMSSTDPNGLVTTFAYNDAGLVERITGSAPNGEERVTIIAYDAAGDVSQFVAPDGVTTRYERDSVGRVLATIDSLGQRVEFSYDERGNQTERRVVAADGFVVLFSSAEFDEQSRPILLSSPEDKISQTSLVYDDAGNLIGSVDPNGNAFATVFDPLNRPVESLDPLGSVTSSVYDSLNNLVSYTAANNVKTTFEYDKVGRLITERSPDRGILSFTYDQNDNVTSRTDARGIRMEYTYDELDRLIGIGFPDASENIAYNFDEGTFGLGRLTGRSDESGAYNYRYNAFGNLTQVTRTDETGEHVTAYEYDAGDKVTEVTYPSGRKVSYEYDALARIQAIRTEINGAAQSVVSDVRYRADDRLVQRRFGNGAIDARKYDQRGQLIEQTLGGGALDRRAYVYDANGNLTGREASEFIGQQSYEFDELDRLSSNSFAGRPSGFTFDPNGNRLKNTKQAESTSYDYQPGTNRLFRTTKIINGASDEQSTERRLIYNDAGRLSEITEDGTFVARYVYGSDGLRRSKKSAEGVVCYHYDLAGRLIAETNEGGDPKREYIWQGASPVAQIDIIDGLDQITYLHTDHLLTPRLATNNAGTVVWRWSSEDAFGGSTPRGPDGRAPPLVEINLRFPGQYSDSESRLHYNGFRYYVSQLGRYSTVDPIGLSSGDNLYAYGGQNPGSLVDPKGLILDTVADLGFIAYDLFKVATDPCNREEHLTALGLDVLGFTIPFATGGGAAFRTGKSAENLLAAKKSDSVLADQRVLLDSSVVPPLRGDPSLNGRIYPGEAPVVSHVTRPELRNAVSTGRLRGVPKSLNNIPVVSSQPSLNTRINIRGQLPAGRGRFGDGIIGGQAIDNHIPLITNDRALQDTVRNFGGEVR